MRFVRRLLFGVVCLTVIGLLGGSVAGATQSALPLTGFSRMLLDEPGHQMFVEGASTDSSILVLDEAGSVVGSIPGESGAGGMALDGSTLYVAHCGQNGVDVIDAATLAKTGSISVTVSQSCDIAVAGGQLWYVTPADGLASVSLDASHTVNTLHWTTATVGSVPNHPNWLIRGMSGDMYEYSVWDVSDPTAPVALGGFSHTSGGAPTDVAVSFDGSNIFFARATQHRTEAFSLPSFTAGLRYPAATATNAVAAAPDNSNLAVGLNQASGPNLAIYKESSGTLLSSIDLGTAGGLYQHGLLYNETSDQLFAVTQGDGSQVIFNVLPARVGSLTIKASAKTILVGRHVAITAHLGTKSANRTVAIYRTALPDGTPKLVASGTVNAKGNLSIVATPKQNTGYSVSWTGDATHAAPQPDPAVRVKVKVRIHAAAKGGYATSNGYRLYHYTNSCATRHTGCPTFLTYATPLHPNKAYTLRVQGRRNGRWITLITANGHYGANGKSLVHLIYKGTGIIGMPTRVQFAMKSDLDHAGNHSRWMRFEITR